MAGQNHPLDDAAKRRGRHRAPRQRGGPLVPLACVVVLLVAIGAAAVLLPPSLAGAQHTADDTRATATPMVSAHTTPAAPAPTTTPSPKTRTTSAPPSRKPTVKSRHTSAPRIGDRREQQVLALVNKERTAHGCGTVTINDRLAEAARLHSKDQAAHNEMSHTGSDGSSPWDRAKRAGYEYAIGENVAAGYPTAEAVMEGWMNSPGHRANILNCDAKAIGIGVAAAHDGTLYWTQMFGSVA